MLYCIAEGGQDYPLHQSSDDPVLFTSFPPAKYTELATSDW